jgi:hypothetical protein
MKAEYFKEDIVGERADSRRSAELVYVPQVNNRFSGDLHIATHEEVP